MEKSFTMQASAHAFEVLSKSLYKNEVLAIIRELSSNAQDAHVAAGVEEPFDLHLPTREEPFFDIRDYGTGISEDLIYDVYTSFFLSTKTDVEDQIGAFGLGSKTPFSLVDKYFVTSYCDDRKKVYKMEKVDGLPTVEKISDEPKPSYEKDGLEIKFDVALKSSYDNFTNWTEEAIKFFTGTTFLPNINTFTDINWEKFSEQREFYTNDNVEFNSCYRPTLSINVAGVRFFIDSNDFNTCILTNAGVSNMNIVAGKSDVTITPSREALHFDQKTIQFLTNRIDSLLKEHFQHYWDNFDKITYKEALKLIQYQKYDIDLNKKLEQKISSLFFDKKLFSSTSGRGVRLDTQNILYNSAWLNTDNFVLVNVSGIKTTVKQNVVNNFYNHQTFDDKGRLSSTSFANVVKSMVSDRAMFLFPKTAADFEKCKEFLGDGATVKYWKDYCDLKKESSGRKIGFKTRQTLLLHKNDEGRYHEVCFYGNNPDLTDEEIGLIYEENTNYNKWYCLIRNLLPSFKIALRPCKESVFKKYKEKGFQTIKEYALDLVLAKKDEILTSIKTTKIKVAIGKCFYHSCFEAGVFEAINDSKYDELENVPAFKTLREIYNEDNLSAKENNAWSYIPDGFLPVEELPDYSINFKSDFPLTNSIGYITVENIIPFLDYLLLYYRSGDYEKNLKKNEIAA